MAARSAVFLPEVGRPILAPSYPKNRRVPHCETLKDLSISFEREKSIGRAADTANAINTIPRND